MKSVMIFDEKNVAATVDYLKGAMPAEKTKNVDLQQVIQVAAIEKFCSMYGDMPTTIRQIEDESKLFYLNLWRGLCCTFSVNNNGRSVLSQDFEISDDVEKDWNVAGCSFYIYAS
ncbi:hypothetical protein [Vibrio parahaemolyticus]|uniref:hypothetical protein n=1 Tax=Vibrio parahaemolyticus TaxID=670 RepID=UPI0003FA2B58|nr:hypothetical protein [Vibrio parahaemolyticus]HCE5184917.1 hypothetical protein [Vibrio parahaemolyticus]